MLTDCELSYRVPSVRLVPGLTEYIQYRVGRLGNNGRTPPPPEALREIPN
jgi:hypothetical protein